MKVKGWGKGVNKDQPPWELAEGLWSDCQNMRFRAGKAQRMGGIASVITPSITPYYVQPYSSGATRYAFYAGLTKAYVHDGTSETEVTKTVHPAVQTVSSLTRVKATGVCTVTTAANHGLATNDVVTVAGFGGTGAGGGGTTPISYLNAVDATITVTGATTFTFVGGTPGQGNVTSATGLGTYSITYSSADTTSAFTATADTKWSGDNFNGVIFANSPNDGIYYWDQTVTGKLHAFADTSVTVQDAARCFKNYIFLLAPTMSSKKYRHRIQWSQSADPGSVPTSFTASATNDAGFLDLVSEGEMVDAKEFGDVFFVYKRDKRFSLRYIGGQYVFDAQLVSGNHKDDGLLAVGCIANTPKGQVFLTDGHDVRIHTGGESHSIAIGRVLDWIKANIDSTYRKRSFLCVNPPYNEVWVCIPESGNSTVSKALVWNWEDDTWGFRSLSNVTAAGSGEYPTSIANDARLLIANSTPKIGLVDSGTTDFGSAYTSSLERTGMDFDDPRFKSILYSVPYFDGSTNFTASIYHGAAVTQDAAPTYSSAATYTHNTTNMVYAQHPAGRFLAYKITTTASDTPSLISTGFEIKTLGMV